MKNNNVNNAVIALDDENLDKISGGDASKVFLTGCVVVKTIGSIIKDTFKSLKNRKVGNGDTEKASVAKINTFDY